MSVIAPVLCSEPPPRVSALRGRDMLCFSHDWNSDPLSKTDDAAMMRPWTLLKNGTALMTMPKIAVYRSFVVNHLVHHRGQLSVYLRMMDVPVPSIYGPSADEGSM